IKHQRTELSYLDRPRRVNSSVFQEDIVSSKDSGHGDSEQGDSDHDATNRLHSSDECKALGHSDRCWMPSFVPGDGRHGADYRSNLHVPGMDAVMDGEVDTSASTEDDPSFSTFGKDRSHHHGTHTIRPDSLICSGFVLVAPRVCPSLGTGIRHSGLMLHSGSCFTAVGIQEAGGITAKFCPAPLSLALTRQYSWKLLRLL
ncbi:protocadherin-10-like isoform X1, partial [Clarias magur]